MSTGETANFLMLGRETRLPDQLQSPTRTEETTVHEYVQEMVQHLNAAHIQLIERQERIRSEGSDEPLLFKIQGIWY